MVKQKKVYSQITTLEEDNFIISKEPYSSVSEEQDSSVSKEQYSSVSEEQDSSVSEEQESSVSEEQVILSSTDIVIYVIKDFYYILIGLFISIYFYYKLRNSKINLYKKILYIMLPTILTFIIFIISNSPKPIGDYYVSLIYGDDPIKTDTKQKKNNKGWPFVGAATIKINGINHLFVGNGNNGKDALFLFNTTTQKFDNVIDKTNIRNSSFNTYSVLAYDINNDGKDDIIIGRDNGVTIYLNNGGYSFTEKQLVGKLDKVPLAIAVSDYNKDGKSDLYISYFTHINKYKGTIFNDPSHGVKNLLLKNTSTPTKMSFKDVTHETNAGGMSLNTFTSAFVDLNNTEWPDIVLSHDSGEVEILKNNHGKFESKLAYDKKGNWMGLAVADINNDGLQDLFLTNIGDDVIRDKLSLGDIKEGQEQAFGHALLINKGNHTFKEESKDYGISGDGFGWGAIFADTEMTANNNLLFAENTLLYPIDHILPQPGYYYENNGKKFNRKFKYNNSYFGQTPMHVDIDGDNKKDIIWINMNGPVNTYLNKNNTNYIIVNLPSNAHFLNAKLVLNTGSKKIYKENIHGGLGFGGDDNDNNILFGLGKLNKIKDITIYATNDKIYTIKNPRVNSIIKPKIK